MTKVLLLFCTLASTGFAHRTITGTARYIDQDFNISGLTGTTTSKPARYCIIKVVDAFSRELGTGQTDGQGNFSFDYSYYGIPARVIMVARSASYNTKIQVGNLSPYYPTWANEVVPYTVPPSHWNVGVVTAPIINDPTGGGRVGNPYNLLDEAVSALQFLDVVDNRLSMNGVYSVQIRWPSDDGVSFYTPGTRKITMGNDDCFDDTILHHEFGHLIHNYYGDSDSPGGQHFLCESDQDPALSWSEGFATFWGSNVRKFQGLADPGIYVDTSGQPGTGNLSFSYRLEDFTNSQGLPLCSSGMGSGEIAVQCALWDITDEPGDNLTSPLDDDQFNGSVLPGGLEPMHAIWDVFDRYMEHFPAGPILSGDIQFNHFRDGWSVLGYMENIVETDAFLTTLLAWGLAPDIELSATFAPWDLSFTAKETSPYRWVWFGFSLTGNGPIQLPIGTLELTPPLRTFGFAQANGDGVASLTPPVPADVLGMQVWAQAFDIYTKRLSNGVSGVAVDV